MKLRFTPRAAQDIAAIADYIRAQGVRKLVTRKYPYLVYYTVDEAAEEIVILTIQHPAREREHEDA
jgi:toxin ParE1/3/4